jgi:hypothetical protein
MIYLIGPPRGGKTTMAESLAKEKSIPYFSIDHVTSVSTPYIPEHEHESAFPLHTASEGMNYSNDLFSRSTPSDRLWIFICGRRRRADPAWKISSDTPWRGGCGGAAASD